MSKPLPPIPTRDQVDKHFKGQQPSAFVPMGRRDQGVTIVQSPEEIERKLVGAQAGQVVPAFRLRNGEKIIPDPVARIEKLIQLSNQGATAEEIKAEVRTQAEQLFYLAFYGDMTDYQRANVLQKLYRITFDEQRAALDELYRQQQIEDKREKNLLAALDTQRKIEAAKAARGPSGISRPPWPSGS